MNILVQYFFGGRGTGALEHFLALLKSYRNENRHDNIFVLCRKDSPINKIKYIVDNVSIIHYGGTIFGLELERILLMSFGIKKIINKHRIDILWNVNLGSYSKLSIPQVVSLSNYFQVCSSEKIKNLELSRKEKIRLYFLRFFYELSLQNVNIVTVQTHFMKQAVRKNFDKKIVIISKSFDNEKDYNFNKKYSPNPEINNKLIKLKDQNCLKLIYISSFYPHKNHKLLINIAEILLKIKFEFVLILSLSKDTLIENFGSRARKLIDNGNIIPLSWVDKSYLKSLYSLSDIVIIPSLLESFSSAHIEAMQFKKPIITTDFNFTREVCGNAAIYLSEKKVDDWVEAIIELSINNNLKKDLIYKGTKQINKFPSSWDIISRKMKIIFQELYEQ